MTASPGWNYAAQNDCAVPEYGWWILHLKYPDPDPFGPSPVLRSPPLVGSAFMRADAMLRFSPHLDSRGKLMPQFIQQLQVR